MKNIRLILTSFMLCAALTGCMGSGTPDSPSTASKPQIPERLETSEDGAPILTVYDADAGKIERMDLETYVQGVVAGEMKNDWPMEALKTQAILARTFTLKFCQDKKSMYDGANISTDVSEAQAYDAASVNDRVKQAVEETRGQVMSWQGEYPYAWFHAHSGGMTELPSAALDYKQDDPAYLKPTESMESDKAPDNARQWKATFTTDEVKKAAADAGLKIETVKSVEIGEKAQSGRAKTLLINGESVSAPSFRIRIGANRLRSTLIEEISLQDNHVTFSGRGFGHGVGLSQWGAYEMAEQGKDAKEIIEYYFKDVEIVKLY